MVCEVYLRVRDAKKLFEAQKKVCARCDIIMRALAHFSNIVIDIDMMSMIVGCIYTAY